MSFLRVLVRDLPGRAARALRGSQPVRRPGQLRRISDRDTVAAGRAYQRRFKVPYPLANHPSGQTWARWRVPYQPVLVLIDEHGRIAERFDGGTPAAPSPPS